MTQHFELFVEEPSMEAFLRAILPRLLPRECSFHIYVFQGKQDLLKKLPDRLRGYSSWIPDNWRIVVVVDQDDQDCHELKEQLEQIARQANLHTRSQSGPCSWQIVNRIAIEELEAWYFGDWDAVSDAYPKVSPTVPRNKKYHNPDAIAGGTWEALERLLKWKGYFKSGLPKITMAREVGKYFDPFRCRSGSFICFRNAMVEAVRASGDCK